MLPEYRGLIKKRPGLEYPADWHLLEKLRVAAHLLDLSFIRSYLVESQGHADIKVEQDKNIAQLIFGEWPDLNKMSMEASVPMAVEIGGGLFSREYTVEDALAILNLLFIEHVAIDEAMYQTAQTNPSYSNLKRFIEKWENKHGRKLTEYFAEPFDAFLTNPWSGEKVDEDYTPPGSAPASRAVLEQAPDEVRIIIDNMIHIGGEIEAVKLAFGLNPVAREKLLEIFQGAPGLDLAGQIEAASLVHKTEVEASLDYFARQAG